MAKEPPLTFEQFVSAPNGVPNNDNFPLFFWRGYIADFSRNFPYYQKFRQVAPDLEQRLRERMSLVSIINIETMKPINNDL